MAEFEDILGRQLQSLTWAIKQLKIALKKDASENASLRCMNKASFEKANSQRVLSNIVIGRTIRSELQRACELAFAMSPWKRALTVSYSNVEGFSLMESSSGKHLRLV